MSGLLAALPLHLACQLISPTNLGLDSAYVPDTSTERQSIVLPEGYTAFPDIELAYKYYENKLSWNAARKLCITEGGNLAVIDSFKKIEYVTGIRNRSETIHTGIHRLFNNAEWISVKGQPLTLVPWKPNVALHVGQGDCGSLWYDGSGLAPWDCSKVLPAVCEIPIFKSNTNRARICERGSYAESPENSVSHWDGPNLDGSIITN